jgi:hypothetical protein
MYSARAGLAIVAGILIAACSSSPSAPSPTPATISLASSAWETISEPQPFPFPLVNFGGLTFQFPSDGSINYLFTASPMRIVHGTLSVSVRVDTLGAVVFNSIEPLTSSCTIPPSVRPFLWANNNGNGDYDRWWSNPRSYALAAGYSTITLPLTAVALSSVNGNIGNDDPETKFAFD